MGTELPTPLYIAGLALLGAVCTPMGMAAEPAVQRVTESTALATVLAIEKLADKARQKVDMDGYGSLSQAEKEAHAAAVKLARQGTELSCRYFLGLQALYGQDGGGSLLCREMEEEYYAKPGNIENPVTTQVGKIGRPPFFNFAIGRIFSLSARRKNENLWVCSADGRPGA